MDGVDRAGDGYCRQIYRAGDGWCREMDGVDR